MGENGNKKGLSDQVPFQLGRRSCNFFFFFNYLIILFISNWKGLGRVLAYDELTITIANILTKFSFEPTEKSKKVLPKVGN